MRLVTFSDVRGMRIGVHDQESNTIVDLSASTRLPKEMTAFVALGKKGLSRARKALIFGTPKTSATLITSAHGAQPS